MAWEKSRDRWLDGRIEGKVDWNDVENWLRSDPIWDKADKIDFAHKNGSHLIRIYVRGLGQILPEWSGDQFSVSTTGGRWVKKWIVEQLVKGYRELSDLYD